MPDVLAILYKQWKLIVGLSLAAALLSLLICLLQPKEFLATVTALPANSALADKARAFNNNIEALYPEIGSPDELDRIEGTGKLDTIYLFVAEKLNLQNHYNISAESLGVYKAAMKLKKVTAIRRSAYGELKINVWDKNPLQASKLANAILEKLNTVHQSVQVSNNTKVLAQLQSAYSEKLQTLDSLRNKENEYEGASILIPENVSSDSTGKVPRKRILQSDVSQTALEMQLKEYQQIISQYELSTKTVIQPLIVVESARPSLQPDRPRIMQTVLFAFGASFVFSFFLAVFAESRIQKL